MAAGGNAPAGRSRQLFLWDDGRPMRFYVRPGLTKLRLAPLLLAGGGRLCRIQEPGAVLLAQPGEVVPGGAVSAEAPAGRGGARTRHGHFRGSEPGVRKRRGERRRPAWERVPAAGGGATAAAVPLRASCAQQPWLPRNGFPML